MESEFDDGLFKLNSALRWRRTSSSSMEDCRKLGDSLQHFALSPYRVEQLAPRLIERLRAFRLQIRSKLVEIDPCVSEISEDAFAVPAISRKCTSHIPMLTECKQSLLRHGINRVRRSKCIDIEN